MQFISKKTDNTIETHIKMDFSSDEMKKRVPDSQNLNTFSEANKSIAEPKFSAQYPRQNTFETNLHQPA